MQITSVEYGTEFLDELFNTELPEVGETFVFSFVTENDSSPPLPTFGGRFSKSVPVNSVDLSVAESGPNDAFIGVSDDYNLGFNSGGDIEWEADASGNVQIDVDIFTSSAGPFFSADSFEITIDGLSTSSAADQFSLSELVGVDFSNQVGTTVTGDLFFFAGGLNFELQALIRADLTDVAFFGFASPTSIPGDYNGDGQIDSGDYDDWQLAYGQQVVAGSGADGNDDGVVDAADYTVWRDAASASNVSISVPEPTSAVLFAMCSSLMSIRWRYGW